MSHVTKTKTQITDAAVIRTVAEKLGHEYLGHKIVKLFGDNKAEGEAVKFDSWKYPVVFDTKTGDVSFDNFNGHWGDIQQLNQFKAEYACELALQQCQLDGFEFASRETLADGSIRLVFNDYS